MIKPLKERLQYLLESTHNLNIETQAAVISETLLKDYDWTGENLTVKVKGFCTKEK